MRVLLFGAGGQLGFEFRGIAQTFAEVVAVKREIPLEDAAAVRKAIAEASPDAIVNCASYNDVDGAEKDPKTAFAVNATAVEAMGDEAKRRGAVLVHFSTDFVFDGEKTTPYVEADATHPLGEYARSKLAGEERLAAIDAPAIVLRTAWVYSLRRKSFVSAMLKLAREREEMKIVSDQVGSPTFSRDLASVTALLLFGARDRLRETFEEARGVYHLAGDGHTTRYDLAMAAFELDPRREEHKVKRIIPVTNDEFVLPAKRPRMTALDCSRLHARFGLRMPPWRDGLARALARRMVG